MAMSPVMAPERALIRLAEVELPPVLMHFEEVRHRNYNHQSFHLELLNRIVYIISVWSPGKNVDYLCFHCAFAQQ